MSNSINTDITARLNPKWTESFDKAKKDIEDFKNSNADSADSISQTFTAAGVAIGVSVAAFGGLIKSSIDTAARLKDLSVATGISVENLSGLEFAASKSGTDLDQVAKSVERLSINIAKNGEKFKQLGIDARDPLNALAQLADVFISIDDPQQRAAVAAAALGKEWATSAPLLELGGKALKDMVRDGADAANITTDLANKSAYLNDRLDDLTFTIKGFGGTLAGPVVDALVAFDKYVTDINAKLYGGQTAFSVYNFAVKAVAETLASLVGLTYRVGIGFGALGAKIASIATLDFGNLSVIDDAFNEDIKKADARYKNFVENLDKPLATASENIKKQAPSQAAIDALIGVKDDQKDKPNKKTGGGRSLRIEDGARELESLNRQIALLGVVTEEERIRYEVTIGSLKNISALKKDGLIAAAAELDSQKEFNDILSQGDELAKKQSEAMKQVADDAKKLKAELADFTPPASGEFEQRLYRIDDALKQGIFTAQEAAEAQRKLGEAFNAGAFDTSGLDAQKEKVSELSEFAIQASRNLQSSLADALKSGFQGGLDDMLKSFVGFLADAAAQAASSQLLELFKGGGKSGGSGILGSIFSGLFSGVAGAREFGGPVTAGKSYLVGERRPEIFTPKSDGFILPSTNISGGSGGNVYNVTVAVNQNSSDSPDATGQKIAESFIRSIARQEITTAARPGNTLNKVTNFG